MTRIVILVDYRSTFYSSVSSGKAWNTMDVPRMKELLSASGIPVTVTSYSDVNLESQWSDAMVLYQSAEDPGLDYRSYIEDMILALSLAGANVIPPFQFLRAHHNKAFLELLRPISGVQELKTLRASVYGTYEEFCANPPSNYPCIIKAASGCGSKGVVRAVTPQAAMKVAKTISWSRRPIEWAKETAKSVLRPGYVKHSRHRRKFIAQQEVPGLSGDYKVLVYGRRVFVLWRAVRPHDFRASGSGLFSWPEQVPDALLDFALRIRTGCDVPYVSLDIAEKDGQFYVLEAQFVDFGTLTLEKSPRHWMHNGSTWSTIKATACLEETLVSAVLEYIKDRQSIDEIDGKHRALEHLEIGDTYKCL